MFSGASDVSMVDLLDSCSSIQPSPPVWTPSPKPVQSSTPNSISTSNMEPSLPLRTASPKLIHSNTSNSTEPSQPLTHSTTLKTSTNSRSKRKALFPQEEPEGSFPTVAKTRLPDHLPFPDRFSIRVEEAITLLTSALLLCFEQTPSPGRLQKNGSCNLWQIPELRDSNPSSYWLCLLYIIFFSWI